MILPTASQNPKFSSFFFFIFWKSNNLLILLKILIVHMCAWKLFTNEILQVKQLRQTKKKKNRNQQTMEITNK